MKLLRNHWYDIGIFLAVCVGLFLVIDQQSGLSLVLWLSLISLWLHQFEEYRYPGYFPGMVNSVLFASKHPDRFPLNTQTSLIVNVVIGWIVYFLAALFADKALWLGIATMLVSLGNLVAHTILFNVTGKTFYNPGMLSSIIFFLPISAYFFYFIIGNRFVTLIDWVLGIVLGFLLNYIGILKMIDWLKDENTTYIFPQRNLIPERTDNVK